MTTPGKVSKALAALLLAVASAAILAACDRRPARTGAGEGKKLTIAVTPWPASAAVYIAREKGFFRDEGLDANLESYLSGHLGLGAVLSGKADLATVTETPIARAAIERKPVAVVATVCEIDRAIRIIARKDRGISRAEDLIGRKIGLVEGTAAEFFLDIYLTISHVDPRDVRIISLAPDRVVRALLSGEVDAVTTWAPHTSALQKELGDNATVLHDPGLYTMTWNIVAKKELAARDPDLIARFLRAVARANRLIAEEAPGARDITAKGCGMDLAAVEREWSNCRFTAQLDQTLVLYLEDQARWMIRKKGGGGKTTPAFLDHIDTRGLKTVRPEAVRIVID